MKWFLGVEKNLYKGDLAFPTPILYLVDFHFFADILVMNSNGFIGQFSLRFVDSS